MLDYCVTQQEARNESSGTTQRVHGLDAWKSVLMCVKCTDEGYADGGTSGMKGFPVIAAFKLSKIDRPCLRAVEI